MADHSHRALDQAEDSLAEMCWCGHDWRHHTDSDTPACYWPLFPEESGFWDRCEAEEAACECDGWWPMNEDPPEFAGGFQ